MEMKTCWNAEIQERFLKKLINPKDQYWLFMFKIIYDILIDNKFKRKFD